MTALNSQFMQLSERIEHARIEEMDPEEEKLQGMQLLNMLQWEKKVHISLDQGA